MEPKKVDLLAKKLRRKNIWGQKNVDLLALPAALPQQVGGGGQGG